MLSHSNCFRTYFRRIFKFLIPIISLVLFFFSVHVVVSPQKIKFKEMNNGLKEVIVMRLPDRGKLLQNILGAYRRVFTEILHAKCNSDVREDIIISHIPL